MIQIDISMPKSCHECLFIKCGCVGDYCVLDPDPRSNNIEEYTKMRSPRCPLIEVKAEKPKHENLKIPKCCGECDSMKSMRGPFGDPFFYCGSPTHLIKDPMQDISTARVGLFSRPEWCPLVETQKALDAMPPEKREKADMMMRGLKAMFGAEGDE